MTIILQYGLDALSLGSLYALFALGIALIFGVMRLLNFAHGDLIMAGGYATALLGGVWWPIVVAATLITAIVLALLMERAAFRPVRNANPATLLITSFALSYLLENLAILVFGARARGASVVAFLGETITVAGLEISRLSVATIIVTAGLLGGLVLFLHRTRTGIQMRAAAEDFATARMMGVRANTVIAVAFSISGLLAAVSALLLVSQTGVVTFDMGITPVLIAFVATIIGGMGSLVGAVLGGYLLGITTVLLDSTLPLGTRPWRDALVFSAVIAVLMFRPDGLVPNTTVRTTRV